MTNPEAGQTTAQRGASHVATGDLFGGAPRYNWEIEIVAEREEDTGLRVRFQGTHQEASRKADRLAYGAPYEVRECVLHRCGLLSPNKHI